MTEIEMLIRLSEQVKHLETLMTNHLHHHFIYNVTLLGGFISTTTAFALYWLKSRARPTGRD
jgi:hypothetical protein